MFSQLGTKLENHCITYSNQAYCLVSSQRLPKLPSLARYLGYLVPTHTSEQLNPWNKLGNTITLTG